MTKQELMNNLIFYDVEVFKYDWVVVMQNYLTR